MADVKALNLESSFHHESNLGSSPSGQLELPPQSGPQQLPTSPEIRLRSIIESVTSLKFRVLLVLALLTKMYSWYRLQLVRRPVLTQAATTAILFATGDVMAQQLVEKVGADKHSYARTGRMALYGGAVFGPAATVWYKFLQRNVTFKNKNLTIAAQVLTDQTVFASTNLFVFLSSMAVMEGSSPKDKLANTYFTALEKNWMVWPAVQAVNFKLVPLEHRVLVVNVVSLGWNCYLSYVNSKGGKHTVQLKGVEELFAVYSRIGDKSFAPEYLH